MTDLRERAPAQATMEKVVSLRGTPELLELPLGIVYPSKDGLNWIRGARDELEMARRLERLGEDWIVLHSIPVGERESDIDQLVVGPGGVFPINTKRLIDRTVVAAGERLTVDGQLRPYLRNSAFECERVEAVLERAGIRVPVLPVIAISGAKRISSASPSWEGRAVDVVRTTDVVRRLASAPRELTGYQVEAISRVLGQSSAWSQADNASPSTRRMRTAFRRIDRGIGRYRAAVLVAIGLVVGVPLAVAGSIIAAVLVGKP